MPLFHRQLIVALLFACLSLAAQGQPLRIVSEAWPPYIHDDNGVLRGLDYEAAHTVLQRLGVEVEWQLLPWRRCLMAMEQGQADGILGIFHTPEREASMLFPHEPLSQVELVLFYAKANPHPFHSLADLRGLKIGVSAGYWYSDRAFRESTLFTREPAPSHAANFGKLVRKRVDLVINDRRGGHFVLAQTGLDRHVRQHPRVISRDQMYLGLRRDAGLEELARRFANELHRFKREPAYAALQARYKNPAHARLAARPSNQTANH